MFEYLKLDRGTGGVVQLGSRVAAAETQACVFMWCCLVMLLWSSAFCLHACRGKLKGSNIIMLKKSAAHHHKFSTRNSASCSSAHLHAACCIAVARTNHDGPSQDAWPRCVSYCTVTFT